MEPTFFYVGLYFLVSLLHLASSRVDSYNGWKNSPNLQYHIQTDEGEERYFKYQTKSGQYRKEKRLQDGTVVGTYGWVDPDGYLRLRDYIADNQGYRIVKTKVIFVGGKGSESSTPETFQSKYSSPSDTFQSKYSSPSDTFQSKYSSPSDTFQSKYSSPPSIEFKPPLENQDQDKVGLSSYLTPTPSTYAPPIAGTFLPAYDGRNYDAYLRARDESTQVPLYNYPSAPHRWFKPSTATPIPCSADYSSDKSGCPPLPLLSKFGGYSSNSNFLTEEDKTRGYYSKPLVESKNDFEEYDGVSTVQNGFRYYLPRHYHEEQTSLDGQERTGSFGYIDPFGIRRVIYYNTAPGRGFVHRKNNRYVGFNAAPYDPRPNF